MTGISGARFAQSARLRITSITDSLDRNPQIVLATVSLAYLLAAIFHASRPLWYDELLTYHIATASTWERFIGGILFVDLTPPLLHLLSRASIALVGDSPVALRLPSVIAFFVASLCVYHPVCHRLGALYGIVAMLVLWLSPLFQNASEARPYALVLMFTGIAMVCWDQVTLGRRSRLKLIGISLGIAGAFMSHCFAIAAVAPFFAAEFVRTFENRRPDYPVWAALLAPLPVLALYVPLVRNYHQLVTPPAFTTSWGKVLDLYQLMLESIGFAIVPAIIVGIAMAWWIGRQPSAAAFTMSPPHKAAFVGCLLLEPVIIHLLLRPNGGAYWPRYSIVILFGFAFLVVTFIAAQAAAMRVAAAVTSAIMLLTFTYGSILHPIWEFAKAASQESARPSASVREISPHLPFVAASGLTFLEMNQREDPSFLPRLFYLNDRESSVRYAHTNIFEGFPVLAKWFPIRANITRYRDFVARHRRFLVLGTVGYPEDWLIPKLMDSGASLRFLGEFPTGYKDRTLFEVTMPAAN